MPTKAKKQVESGNPANAILKHPYLISTVIVLILVGVIVIVTCYYASYYPTTDITNLPRISFAGALINIFNGYTEKLNWNAAETNVLGAAVAMLAAVLLICFYSSRKGNGTTLGDKWRPLWSFLLALVSSQYIIQFLLLWKRGNYASGISFFFVDSTAIVVLFCFIIVGSEYLKLLRERPPLKEMLERLLLWALMALLIVGFISIVFGTLLLQNLGYSQYNQAFADTYQIHKFGLIEFSVLFFLFWLNPLRFLRAKPDDRPEHQPQYSFEGDTHTHKDSR